MSDLRESFDRDGYCVARGVFDAEWLARLEPEFDRIVTQITAAPEETNALWESAGVEPEVGAAEPTVTHTHNVQNYSAVWLQALLEPAFLDRVEALVGPDIVLHHSKLFEKPPGHGAPFPMHQDWRYFPTAADSMLAAVIHVSEATDDMGCLRVHPGSHKMGHRRSTSGHVDWDSPEAYRTFSEEFPLETADVIEAEPGDVMFFSYLTVHGSGPNRSDRTRKTVLTQLYSGQDQLDRSSRHHVSGLVLRGWNHDATRSTVAPRPAPLTDE